MKRFDKKKRILVIAPQVLPIPAVKGGAVETLLTDFIVYNERFEKAELSVITISDSKKINAKLNFTSFLYFDSNNKKASFKKFAVFILYSFWLVFRKLFYRKERVNYNLFGFYVNMVAHRIKPDIVLSEGYDKITRLWQVSNYVGPDNCYYHLHYSKKENIAERKLFSNSICVSEFVKNKWCLSPIFSGRNFVLYNGIKLKKFTSKEVQMDRLNQLKSKLGIRNHDFIVIFVGRFRPGKGLIELLTAFDFISDKSVKLLLVGDFIKTSFDEKEFENKVNSLIEQNPSVIRVGKVDQEILPYYYTLSDIQVIPSTCEEAAGLVAIEGMSFGLPIIATKSGGLVEYISSDCSIQLEIDENLPKNISIAIEKLRVDVKLRNKMSALSKERSSFFSIEKYCDGLLNCLCLND